MSLPAKLTIGSTFGIHPPLGGGQLRIFHLYRHIARRCPVDVIALVAPEQPPVERELSPGLKEIRVPKSADHTEAEWELEREARVPVTDVAFPSLHRLTPGFGSAVARSAAVGGALVASHPYVLPVLIAAGGPLPIWYDVHNVEADLKMEMLADTKVGRKLLSDTRRVERSCCERAELVFAPSRDEANRLQALYGLPEARVMLVPNGVDAGAIRFVAPAQRRQISERLHMEAPLALFVGSWHEPNVRAVRRIVELAPRVPWVQFGVLGSVCAALDDLRLPANMTLFGVVADALKDAVLGVAAVAINPMSEGSGTNMKMLDYLAAGVPVVSTEVGARGLDLDPVRHVRIVPLDAFPAAIRDTLAERAEEAEARARAARRHVEERFDWPVVARTLFAAIDGSSAGDPSPDRQPTSQPTGLVGGAA